MTNNFSPLITKASGEQVPFDEKKLVRSLQRVGANPHLITQIKKDIQQHLTPGMSTHTIYLRAFQLLRQQSRATAAKYRLKKAMMRLGPSGYPFEKYIAEILRYQGYTIATDVRLAGFCVTHEIDVIAEKTPHRCLVECKYHNRPGIKSDVKISLYFHARFQDIVKRYKEISDKNLFFTQGWLVTNTHFTDDAIQYGTCAGLHLLGWNYPQQQSLKDIIENAQLYPITCLTTLKKPHQIHLLAQGVILCKTLYQNPALLHHTHLAEKYWPEILKECEQLALPAVPSSISE